MNNQCNYVDPVRSQLGIQYDNDLFSHTIYNNALCIQSDDEKTTTNIADLEHAAELPIYCVFAHGKIISDINVSFIESDDDEIYQHIASPASTFFNLGRNQYLYDTAPLGSLLMCSPHLNEYFGHVIDNPQEFTELLFSTEFKNVSSPIATGDFDLDSPLFSPPQFTTINKTLDFYEDIVKSPLRFGIVQLNKPIDDEVAGILKSIGTQLKTTTPEEKIARCFNTSISEPGKLTNNPYAEQEFVRHLQSREFRCTLEELTSIFGAGIYIMSTCSPLSLTLNIADIGKIRYSSEVGISSKLKSPSHAQIVEKAVYAFNSDLEAIVYNLNYRWFEMVQNKAEIETSYAFPKLGVVTGQNYPKIANVPSDYEENQSPLNNDETETQPDEDMTYMDDVNGGVKKKHAKKRKQTKKNKNHKKQKTKKHLKRRRQQSRARRS